MTDAATARVRGVFALTYVRIAGTQAAGTRV